MQTCTAHREKNADTQDWPKIARKTDKEKPENTQDILDKSQKSHKMPLLDKFTIEDTTRAGADNARLCFSICLISDAPAASCTYGHGEAISR